MKTERSSILQHIGHTKLNARVTHTLDRLTQYGDNKVLACPRPGPCTRMQGNNADFGLSAHFVEALQERNLCKSCHYRNTFRGAAALGREDYRPNRRFVADCGIGRQ